MLRPMTAGLVWMMALVLINATAWAGPRTFFSEDRRHVALDPGHGGDDNGARGPTGLLEKAFCLELARNLTLRLENRFRVTLTRSDDYYVQLPQRAAIANESRADLFISLHSGASFEHAARGTVIYFHTPSKLALQRSTDGATPREGPRPWRQVQVRHNAGSRDLAQTLKVHLEKQAGFSDVRIQGVPLAPLEGVDMPAVLIEVGHITNPTFEQRLTSSHTVASVAQAIDAGIDDFLRSRSGARLP